MWPPSFLGKLAGQKQARCEISINGLVLRFIAISWSALDLQSQHSPICTEKYAYSCRGAVDWRRAVQRGCFSELRPLRV